MRFYSKIEPTPNILVCLAQWLDKKIVKTVILIYERTYRLKLRFLPLFDQAMDVANRAGLKSLVKTKIDAEIFYAF